MAKVTGPFKIVGKLGDISFYQLPGSDKIYARYASGPSSDQVKNAPNFAPTRRHNSEFGGASTAASAVSKGLGNIRLLKDYNYFGDLAKFIIRIRKSDLVNPLGERSILFTENGKLLDGFNLNKSNPFDNVIRYPILFDISRENSTAVVHIPELIPGYNFYPSKNQSLYEVRISLLLLPDFVYAPNEYTPTMECPVLPTEATTDWHPVIESQPAKDLEIKLNTIPDETCSLLLSVGIRYGTRYEGGFVEPVGKAGSGKILAVR